VWTLKEITALIGLMSTKGFHADKLCRKIAVPTIASITIQSPVQNYRGLHLAWPDRRRQLDHGNDSERSCGPIEISRIHTVSPLEIPPAILPETAGRASMAGDAKTGG
jgi:hypothetical protein